MTRLVVGPFNRVEGDLEVRLEIDGGTVRAAHVVAPMYRGFEQLLRGRAPLDALVVAPRICGICSISQSVAAAESLRNYMGLDMPPNGRSVVDLLLACENAADHLTHFALFFMPDFARPDYRGRLWHKAAQARFAALSGQSGREASAARLRLLHLVGILAGKWPHTLAIQPGGATKSVDMGERMRLMAILAEFRAYLERALFGDALEAVLDLDGETALAAWRAKSGGGDFRLFLDIADDLGLATLGQGPDQFLTYGGPLWRGGIWRQGQRLPLDLSSLVEDVAHAWYDSSNLHPSNGATLPNADRPDAYSWAKAPRLLGAATETGALARQLMAGHPLVADMIAQGDGRANVRSRVVARLLELAALVPRMEQLVRSLSPSGAFCVSGDAPAQGRGVGLVEAARGALGHWLRVEDGVIDSYQIVAPTTWNFSPRDQVGQPGPLEQALVGAPVGEGEQTPLSVQHVVRSFDPCMSCTVH